MCQVFLRACRTARKSQDIYEKALQMFIHLYDRDHLGVQIGWKTICDRFNRMVSDRKEAARGDELTSGTLGTCHRSIWTWIVWLATLNTSTKKKEKGQKLLGSIQSWLLQERRCDWKHYYQAHNLNVICLTETYPVKNQGSASLSARKRLFGNSDDEEKDFVMLHTDLWSSWSKRRWSSTRNASALTKRVSQEAENCNRVYKLQDQRNNIDERQLQLDLQRFDLQKQEHSVQLEQSK